MYVYNPLCSNPFCKWFGFCLVSKHLLRELGALRSKGPMLLEKKSIGRRNIIIAVQEGRRNT